MPIGIQIEGFKDWVTLHYDFVEYLVESNDYYLRYIIDLFKDSIMSPEVFIGIEFVLHIFLFKRHFFL